MDATTASWKAVAPPTTTKAKIQNARTQLNATLAPGPIMPRLPELSSIGSGERYVFAMMFFLTLS
jgi:hypothetical protein